MSLPVSSGPLQHSDLPALVRRIAALDGHPRGKPVKEGETPDTADYEVWWAAAQSQAWTRAEVVAGLAHLMGTFTGFRVMPAHLTEAIAELRGRVKGRWNPPDPPRELADQPEREIRWRRAAAQSYRERAMLALASGGQLDEVPMLDARFEGRPALPPAPADSPAAVAGRRALAAAARRWAAPEVPVPREGHGAPSVAARRALDPRRLAAVRAEVEGRAAVPVPEEAVPGDDPGEEGQAGESALSG